MASAWPSVGIGILFLPLVFGAIVGLAFLLEPSYVFARFIPFAWLNRFERQGIQRKGAKARESLCQPLASTNLAGLG